MLLDVINRIFLNYKLFSACSIGTDSPVNSHLIELFDFVTVFDYETKESLASYSEIKSDNSRQHMPKKSGDNHLFKEFDYLDNKYDLVFISNTFNIDEVRRFFDSLVADKTKFIIIPSKLVYSNLDNYRCCNVVHLGSVYSIYYLDLVSNEVERSLDEHKLH